MLVLFIFGKGIAGIDPLKRLVLEVESDKLRDVYQSKGTVIAVYDPYGKNLKLFHYWIGTGVPQVNWATNTDCSRPMFAWVIVKHPNRKFDPSNDPSLERMVCETDPRVKWDSKFRYIKNCRYPEDSPNITRVMYDERDKSIVYADPVQGAFCRRIVDEGSLGRFGLKFKVRRSGYITTYDGKGKIRNSYFSNISYQKALDLVTFYMYINQIPKGIFTVQTFDVYKTKSSSLFRTKITYHYKEKPIYYVIMAGVSAGEPLPHGYRLLDGQAVGNNLIRKEFEIYSKSKSGWTGFGVLVFQAAFIAAAWMMAAPLAAPMANSLFVAGGLTVQDVVAVGVGLSYLVQDIKSDVFTSLWGNKVFKLKGLVKDAVAGGATVGTSGLIMNDSYADDGNVVSYDGARHITQRVIAGSDQRPTLSGFYEAKKQVDAFRNWKEPAGTTIELPHVLFVK